MNYLNQTKDQIYIQKLRVIVNTTNQLLFRVLIFIININVTCYIYNRVNPNGSGRVVQI